MITGALALSLSLLAGSLQEEDASPLKWVIKKGDQFKLKWTFELEDLTQVGGRGRVPKMIKEKREVEALLTCGEDVEPWRLDMVLTNVKWTYRTAEFEITASKRENKEPDVRFRMLLRRTRDQTGAGTEALEVANTLVEDFKRVLKAPYAMAPINRKQAMIWMDGRTGPAILSVFQHSFIHTHWPTDGTLKVGTRWPESTKGLSPGIPYLDTMEMKLASVDEKRGAVVTGSGKQVLKKQLMPGRDLRAEFNVTRKFTFAPEGYLASSEEKRKYTKDLTARQIEFREKIVQEVDQTLKITPYEEKKRR